MPPRLLKWALTLSLLLTGVAHAEISPYLQTPTSSSIWVTWKTASGTETRVEVGTSQDQLTKIVTGTTQTLASNYLYHSAQITGLQPDTFYYYRVRTGTETVAGLPLPGRSRRSARTAGTSASW